MATERTNYPSDLQNTTLKPECDIDDASDSEQDSPILNEQHNATQVNEKTISAGIIHHNKDS